MDFIGHIFSALFDSLGQAGSRRAWICLAVCVLVIVVSCAWMLSGKQG